MTIPAVAQETPPPDTPFASLSQLEDIQQGILLGAAESNKARPLNPLSLSLIKFYEGWVPSAYDDPSRYCTIGYGHLIRLQPCDSIDLIKFNFSEPLSPATGEKLLISDTATARAAVSSLVHISLNGVNKDLDDNQFGALVSLVFNIGKGNFQRSTLLKVINAGGMHQVPAEFLRWSSSAHHVLTGLVRRRYCESLLFTGTLQPDANGTFNPGKCPMPSGAASDIVHPIDVTTGVSD